ncbi:MAG: CDP-alcohol phosphatidyltransferase family protein [Henriciella sp.]|nr:CDP-alcohol phosphatidyltransferase family protein [Henriciella sp.]
MPNVRLVGELPVKLWGHTLDQWQKRTSKKLGANGVEPDGAFCLGSDWVFSAALAKKLLATPGAVLVVKDKDIDQERIAAVHANGAAPETAEALVNSIDPDWEALKQAGYTPGYMDDFVGDYDHALRKREAPYALSLFQNTPAQVERRLFKGSYKGVTDLVTKYAWPEPALHVTRLCANLRLTPNMVTTASLALVCLAFYYFWIGAWIPGIVAGWAMTFLDTVDGKLARTTMTYSAWGNIYDHGIDLIHPPFWYWAIYTGLIATGVSHPWLLPSLAVIIVGYVIGRITEGIFLRLYGFHIHVWRPIDAFMREITARRNPNLLIFMILALFGAPLWGFILVALWTLICVPFHIVRLVQAMASREQVTSFMDS